LPVARRGITAGVALGFARALGDFGATVMVAGNIPGHTQTLPVAVYDAVQTGDDSTARTGSLVLGAVAVVVLLAVTRFSTPRRTADL
jgi:molybdate transport system permease protein